MTTTKLNPAFQHDPAKPMLTIELYSGKVNEEDNHEIRVLMKHGEDKGYAIAFIAAEAGGIGSPPYCRALRHLLDAVHRNKLFLHPDTWYPEPGEFVLGPGGVEAEVYSVSGGDKECSVLAPGGEKGATWPVAKCCPLGLTDSERPFWGARGQ